MTIKAIWTVINRLNLHHGRQGRVSRVMQDNNMADDSGKTYTWTRPFGLDAREPADRHELTR